jgi:L,D-transpeptidase ErfK/SrfK
MQRRIAILITALLALTVRPALAWEESDFPSRPVVAYVFALGRSETNTVIGEPRSYTFAKGDTLYDVARHLGLGINEVTDAFHDIDVWLPPEGESVAFPTWWVLPESDYQGVVVNIPEMRLYYFPPSRRGAHTVVTYPVGLGRDEWRTPTGKFKVTEKTTDPKWVIPDSIRAEHMRERSDPRHFIPGGAADNPLGHYRIRLSLPLYGIHGTNIPWGVGMEVSHGCIRLYPEDIARLFAIVPVGVPGEIVYEPVKIGARDGDVYVEVHHDIYDTGYDYVTAAKELLDEKRWANVVDWGLLTDALKLKTGVPTPISFGQPLTRRLAEEAKETEHRPARSAPRS